MKSRAMVSLVDRDRRLRNLLSVTVFVVALLVSVAGRAKQPARPAPTPSPAAQPPTAPPAPPIAPPPPETQPPAAAVLGGPGESCRARSDCKVGLLCKAQMCVDPHEGESCGATPDCGGELKCIGGICRSPFTPPPVAAPPIAPSYSPPGAYPAPPPGTAPPAPDKSDWLDFTLEGHRHGFVGTTFIGGPVLAIAGGDGFVNKGFVWALKFGGLFGRNEIALELSPMTYLPFTGLGPSFQTNFTYGYLAKVYEGSPVSVYWPVRFGIGTFFGNTAGLAFFEARTDLLGLAVQVGHVLIDLHLPSFRYSLSPGQDLHFLSWDFGGGLGYAF